MGSGSIVDEIQYSYDDWGNVIKFAMDRNGAIVSGPLIGVNGYYDFGITRIAVGTVCPTEVGAIWAWCFGFGWDCLIGVV